MPLSLDDITTNYERYRQAFADRDFKPFDVHAANVMMRPKTNDIVIVDLGRFKI